MQLITTEDASKMLCVSPVTMKIWRSKNQGPIYVKVQGAVRYKLTDIEQWINQNTCTPKAMQLQEVC